MTQTIAERILEAAELQHEPHPGDAAKIVSVMDLDRNNSDQTSPARFYLFADNSVLCFRQEEGQYAGYTWPSVHDNPGMVEAFQKHGVTAFDRNVLKLAPLDPPSTEKEE